MQVTLADRITLLSGPADFVLLALMSWNLQEDIHPSWYWGLGAGLMLSLSSVLPLWVLLLSYSAAAAFCQFLRQRVWQVPLLTLFTSVVAGTLIIDGITLGYLWLGAHPISLIEAFNLVVLPSIVFNMILALPAQTLVNELSKFLLPAGATR
ncbi:MAG: hypothetical protein O3B43_04460 [Chloroflexi bacterium]|nr:hypothetical protein [Chloroflexota bacterium]